MSSIDIPDGPPPSDPADDGGQAGELPPGHLLGPNIHQAPHFGKNAGRPRDADRLAAEYAVMHYFPQIKPSPVEWLWPGRIPLGKRTLLVGDPGVGKSLVTLDMAARVTRGGAWPDAPDVKQKRGHVLILAAEDTPDDTILPRLTAMGADLAQVESVAFLEGRDSNGWRKRTWHRPISFPDDVKLLDALVAPRYGEPYVQQYYGPDGKMGEMMIRPEEGRFPPTRLILIDPLSAYFPHASGNDNVQVRKMLHPLVELAARYKVAIVGVTHLNKSISQPGHYRTLGSQAFTAVARAVWGVARCKGEPTGRLFLPIKNNLGPAPKGLAFHLKDDGVSWDQDPPPDDWSDAIDRRAEAEAERRWSEDEARAWLKELLEDGELQAWDVTRMASKCGIHSEMIKRAKRKLGVKSRKAGFQKGSHWYWSLPKVADAEGRPPTSAV
jgi:hypothetical protein